MSNNEMRKLINLVESTTKKKIIKEAVGKFNPDLVSSMQEIADEFDDDIAEEFEDEFANGQGVYEIISGSRGEIEQVTFLGKSGKFKYRAGRGEFEGADWEGKTFVNGISEEEAQIFVYWSGK